MELSTVMREEIFMAGLGGQGVQTAGHILTQAAVDVGLEVTWYPSYSPEVRGGSATCTVVISDTRVGSPIAGRPRAMILMDPKSIAEHIGRCAPQGIAVINTGFGPVDVPRDDLCLISIDADSVAKDAGNERAVNMVMLGAYLAQTRPELLEPSVAALPLVFPQRHHRFLPANEEAMRRGAQLMHP